MDEPNLDWTGVVSERLIKEAIEAGEFNNLPGRGQPLPEEVLSTPAYQRFANRVLKEAKVLPEWLELERQIARETELLPAAKQRLLNAIRTAKDAPTRDHLAGRLRTSHRERMDIVNTMVLKYNFHVPASVQKSFRSFNIRQEMGALESEIDAAYHRPDPVRAR
jgi:hypothetical protein